LNFNKYWNKKTALLLKLLDMLILYFVLTLALLAVRVYSPNLIG